MRTLGVGRGHQTQDQGLNAGCEGNGEESLMRNGIGFQCSELNTLGHNPSQSPDSMNFWQTGKRQMDRIASALGADPLADGWTLEEEDVSLLV